MKKRVLSLLLVVAMLASLVVFPAYAEPAGTVLTADTVLEDGGSYYLEEDLVRDTLVVDGITVTIDLNGHVLRAPHGQRMLEVEGVANVTIKDSSAAQTGEMQATGISGKRGGVIMLDAQGSAANAENPLTLNLAGGTIRQLYAADISVTMGGGIELETTVGGQKDEDGNPIIVNEVVVVNMTGGKITDGYVTSRGGNVCLSGGGSSVFNMSDGEIVKGYAPNGGGIYLASGTLTMTGGKVYNNVTEGNGGNINVGATATISKKAEVYGGVAGGFGANIYNNGTTTLDNVGEFETDKYNVKGDIYTANSKLNLVGTVNIPMGNSNGVMIKNGQKLDVSQMKTDSLVYFGVNLTPANTDNSGNSNSGKEVEVSATFTIGGGAAYVDCFRNVGRTTRFDAVEGELVAYRMNDNAPSTTVTESWCPHCTQKVSWLRTSLWGAEGVSHIYNYGAGGTVTLNGSKPSQICVVDMTGTATNQNVTTNAIISVSSAQTCEMWILDTVGGGRIANTATNLNGSVIQCTTSTGTVNLLSGTLTGASLRGGAAYLTVGTLNIKGGIIKDSSSSDGKYGGAIHANGTETTVTMSNGLITNCKAQGTGASGGAIHTTGTLKISGGIIQNCEASYYGTLALATAKTGNEIKNAIIRGGKGTHVNTSDLTKSYGLGGNICMSVANAKLTMDNVVVAGGYAAVYGGNICVYKNATLDMDNVLVYGGKADYNGGNIYSVSAVDLNNATLIGGVASDKGGNIFATNNITLNNSTISGGTATNHGGNIYMDGGYTLDVDNSSISDGTATGNNLKDTGYGGNIYSDSSSAKLLMDNTVVSNGSAATDATNIGRGGNIYFNDGTATLTNCTLNGGKAYYGGSVYCASNLTLENVTVNGGYATAAGGGVYHNRASRNVAFNNVTVNGAKSDGSGGNVRFGNAANVTEFKDVTLINGKAATAGGNLSIEGSVKILIDGLTATGGSAGSTGGNLYIKSGATGTDGGPVVLTNCTFENGHAYADTAERNESSDNIHAEADIVLDGVQVSGNSGQNELGSGVYATAKVTLKNNTVVGNENEPISGSLYLKNAAASLEVDESFSGTVVLSPYWLFGHTTVEDSEGKQTTTADLAGGGFEVYGQILDVATTTGDFSVNGGKLYLGDHKTSGLAYWEYGMPAITGNSVGQLVVDAGAVVKSASGVKHYTNIAEAVDAYDYEADNVLKLVAAEPEVKLTGGGYYIDVNGKNANVTGFGTVYGIDTTNDDHDGCGNLTADTGVTVMAAATDPVTGEVYIRTEDNGKYQFHHIDMDITSVVLRTSNAGVYYKGEWDCDDVLANYLSTQGDDVQYGIVATVGEMPENGFNTREDCLWSVKSGNSFAEQKYASGLVVQNILNINNTDAINAENFETKIKAKAYLMLTEGETETYIVGKTGADMSYLDMFVRYDNYLAGEADLTAHQADIDKMNDFYNNKWKASLDIAFKDNNLSFSKIFQTSDASDENTDTV